MTGRTLHDKLWDQHRIALLDDGSELLHIDRIALHERSGPMALKQLSNSGRTVFDPSLVFGTLDHAIDTRPERSEATTLIPSGAEFIRTFRDETRRSGIRLFDFDDPRLGIVHVTMPRLGVALPGLSFVCADSHTGTIGALGALAWGIGISETEHALATQTLSLRRPKTLRVWIEGAIEGPVAAKDIILALIGQIGANGGAGYMVEFAGPAVDALSIEGRMTLCNMGVEFGAWSAIVAPDQKTFDYVAGREFAPQGKAWDVALSSWRDLRSDPDARFDREVHLKVTDLPPQVTWGTSPEHVSAIGGAIPLLQDVADPVARGAVEKALAYMGLSPGQPLEGVPIDAAFIGSCTNARITDLRAAAAVLKGRRIASRLTRALVVPGSAAVKAEAEAEGLDQIFRAAGFEWREPGCSLCFYGGGEQFDPGSRVASTTNRNFENRQGPGIRTHLMSPAAVAASAVAGALTDPGKALVA